MASKVMVKMPVVQPFTSQVAKGKPQGEVVAIGGRNTEIGRMPDGSNIYQKNDGSFQQPPFQVQHQQQNERCNCAQLEQNIRYLQEQHQLMLTGLHHEIDGLRNRNRELQFQLIFSKGSNSSPSTSSPEEDCKKVASSSPKVLNVTPLQVEILEKELSEMKIQLQESERRNVYLSAIVDEQKKKLERYERDRERERERGSGHHLHHHQPPDPELLRKLDEAEGLIRRLRRENSDLRRENQHNQQQQQQQQLSTNSASNHNNQRPSGNNHQRARRGVSNYNARANWFPPLQHQGQNFWQRNDSRTGAAAAHMDAAAAAVVATLPTLQPPQGTPIAANSAPSALVYQQQQQLHHSPTFHQMQQQQQQQQQRRAPNNNHYGGENSNGRKYQRGRGQKSS